MKCPKCGRKFVSIDNNPRGTTVENYVKCYYCKSVMLKDDVIEFTRKYKHDIVFCDKHNKDKTKNFWDVYECEDCKLELKKQQKIDRQQQRLDNVLSKFDEVSPKLHQITLERTQYNHNEENVLINYNELNGLFYFTTHNVLNIGCDSERIVNTEYLISLKTVESLLEDLQEE